MTREQQEPAVPAVSAADEKTIDELVAESRASRRRATRKLRTQARQMSAAIEGWMGIETPGDWLKACKRAGRNYRSGRFVMERLGAERMLEPELLATLWGLRQALVRDLGAASAAETMLVDMAVLNYATALRLNAMVGNAALTIEHQFFGLESPDARFGRRYGREVAEKLSVEYAVDALRLHLMPLFDRANRGLIRNLQALRDLRQPPTPPVAIGQAGQVNVGGQQLNVAQNDPGGACRPVDGVTGRTRAHGRR